MVSLGEFIDTSIHVYNVHDTNHVVIRSIIIIMRLQTVLFQPG